MQPRKTKSKQQLLSERRCEGATQLLHDLVDPSALDDEGRGEQQMAPCTPSKGFFEARSATSSTPQEAAAAAERAPVARIVIGHIAPGTARAGGGA